MASQHICKGENGKIVLRGILTHCLATSCRGGTRVTSCSLNSWTATFHKQQIVTLSADGELWQLSVFVEHKQWACYPLKCRYWYHYVKLLESKFTISIFLMYVIDLILNQSFISMFNYFKISFDFIMFNQNFITQISETSDFSLVTNAGLLISVCYNTKEKICHR